MDIKEKVAQYVTGLLSVDANTVIIGRENFEKMESNSDFIIVDSLALGLPGARSESFDDVAEEQTFNVKFTGVFTLDFYGCNAYSQSQKLIILQASQANFELCLSIGLSMNYVRNITDLRTVEGSQQNNRMQLEVNVGYEEQATIDTLRIDEAQFEFLND